MIIQTFDKGWGPQWPLKQFEQGIVDSMLLNITNDQSRTIVINSVWYTKEYHQQVLSWLRSNLVDRIVLVAMLDAAIPKPDWYAEFDCEVISLGYYPGDHSLDFCALFVEKFLDAPPIDQLTDTSNINMAYMCLNRKPHWHRQQLYNRLHARDLLQHGIVSMGGEGAAIRPLDIDREHDDLAPNADRKQYGIPNDIVSLGHMQNWQRHFLNIVTETFYDINQTGFVSEKIYKPIVGCRPFLLYDPDGGTRWLRDRGFEPYVSDFQDITAADLSEPTHLPGFLSVLCEQTPEYWQAKYLALQEKILYNKQHFADYVKSQRQLIEKGIPCQV
ncbi:MAG: hypothetical protein ACOYNN_16470 [Terrimicrobiaceae bacterium]